MATLSVKISISMQIKTNTKEKFHAITVMESSLTAIMADELAKTLEPYLQNDIKNLVIILANVATMDVAIAKKLVEIQQFFYENNASFVVCEINKSIEGFLDEHELLELFNATPTESEAWDIVQMEEIERELMGD
jgi:anti-anti-sigma regulatory factor